MQTPLKKLKSKKQKGVFFYQKSNKSHKKYKKNKKEPPKGNQQPLQYAAKHSKHENKTHSLPKLHNKIAFEII